LYISYSVGNAPRLALLFVRSGPKLDGASYLPAVMGREQKLEWGSTAVTTLT